MKKYTLALTVSLLAALPLTFNACNKGSMSAPAGSVFRPDSNLQSTGGGNPIVSELAIGLSPFQPQSIDQLTICISRLRFRAADGSLSTSDVRFNLGDVTLSASGTRLAGVNLPDGTYDEVEMELDNSCPSGKSVYVLRAGKAFSTSRFIKLSFSGRFTAQQARLQLTLGLQEVIKNLNSISSGDEIEKAVESASEKYEVN